MKKLYECILYTFCRGYIHHFGYNTQINSLKLELSNYHKCWLYKILKIFI